MANLNKTRTVFAFTSPRTVEKIIPEIKILIDSFSGQKWNKENQIAFFIELFNSDFYLGEKMPKNVPLAARDRITRAPKALGFVDLKPAIKLTEAGKRLLSGNRIHDVLAKQLLKFQLPSPYHKIPSDRDFNVKPYLELLRLTNTLGNISKTEIAIFFVQLTNYNKLSSVAEEIKQFRKDSKAFVGNRKEFIDNIFNREILKIYTSEVEAKDLKTRQSGDKSLAKFLKTKKANHMDYADAFMRYLRATQLVSFDKRTFRMIIAPSRIDEVNYILSEIDRNAMTFKSEADFKIYLFNPNSIQLLTDDSAYLEKRLSVLGVRLDKKYEVDELKDLLDFTESKIITEAIYDEEVSLKNYKEFENIVDVFEKIIKKEIPDPSLYLEWNVWRSLVMVNYAKDVIGNFRIDLDGVPLSTAGGNLPDIEVQYDGFKMLVEVTMSSGQRQYEMENESVARHYGKVQNATDEPVYCIFIAPKISEATLAYFFDKNIKAPKFYGGKTRIIPMTLDQFLGFITVAKEKEFNNSKTLKSYLDMIIEKNRSIDDENLWFKYINDTLPSWVA